MLRAVAACEKAEAIKSSRFSFKSKGHCQSKKKDEFQAHLGCVASLSEILFSVLHFSGTCTSLLMDMKFAKC
jgi:hypothetical protein